MQPVTDVSSPDLSAVRHQASERIRMAIDRSLRAVALRPDYDVRGELGAGGVRPGYLEIRYTVELDAGPEVRQDALDNIMDLADRHSSLRDVFATGVPLRRVEALKDGSP